MTISVFSDYVCPWCYIALRKIDRTLAHIPMGRCPEIIWRAFQLDPDAGQIPGPTVEQAMRTWYPDTAQANARMSRIRSAGRKEGLVLRLDLARPVNTRDAHCLAKLARHLGLASPLNEAVFRAYHLEGSNIADPEVLVRIAQSVGIDPRLTELFLRSGEGVGEVEDDQKTARTQGVKGVPTLVRDGAQGPSAPISTNQTDEALAQALQDHATNLR
ncbi:DsbA family oxidoreductase [Paracoccus suum]|uniref:DsbA family oxidoreductase n=1 Tax=Paracoccus suum TaxID=2259340 RepID=A0A344PIL5_9RHOB|nr:DsbA family oxidoreductase [Paracoccus suum]AXC49220.1 DsbA family oxidoreductase [Paracoccus suum]